MSLDRDSTVQYKSLPLRKRLESIRDRAIAPTCGRKEWKPEERIQI